MLFRKKEKKKWSDMLETKFLQILIDCGNVDRCIFSRANKQLMSDAAETIQMFLPLCPAKADSKCQNARRRFAASH